MEKEKIKSGSLIFLLAYSIFLFRLCLSNTTFVEYVPINTTSMLILLVIASLLVVIKIIIFDRYTVFNIVLLLIISIISIISYRHNAHVDILVIMLLLIGARNVNLSSIVRCHFYIYFIIMIFGVLFSLMGLIDNYVTISVLKGYRYALGNTYPTDFSAGILYLFFDYAYLKSKWNWRNSVTLAIVAISVYMITRSFGNLLNSLIFICLLILIHNKVGLKIITSRLVHFFSVLLYPILAIISIMAPIQYLTSTNVFLRLFDVISDFRLGYSSQAIKQYGLTLFGEDIKFFGAGWGTNLVSNKYFYVDNGYLQVALLYGVIIIILLCFGFSLVIYKYAKIKNGTVLLIILIVIAIQSVSEPRLFNILYNVFLFSISTELFSSRKCVNEDNELKN